MEQGLEEPIVEDRNSVVKVCNSQRKGKLVVVRPGHRREAEMERERVGGRAIFKLSIGSCEQCERLSPTSPSFGGEETGCFWR